MNPLFSVDIPTDHGEKTIAVFNTYITAFDQPVDILTTSAYYRSYNPSPGTMFDSLNRINISVMHLSREPEIDLRAMCNIWLSKALAEPCGHIRRIGCIEMRHHFSEYTSFMSTTVDEQGMLKSLRAYFQMLDIAATYGVKMDTVAVPVLGSGRQRISTELVMIPLINECVQFLKRNTAVKRMFFIDKDPQKANRVAAFLAKSYAVNTLWDSHPSPVQTQAQPRPMAFISYASADRNVADNLCAKLEARGIQVWYAPRNVHGPYASAIANAIINATHFIVILSKNSMESEHVLNEIDLAFKRLPKNIQFHPLRIDEQKFAPAFDYYLSRQHWMDAYIPPLEQRLQEFVTHLLEEL